MSTLTDIKNYLSYNPESGIFTWLRRWGRVVAGEIASHVDKDGYIGIRFKGVLYRAHRLAFYFMKGNLPEFGVDHINGIKNDNRWLNLREATHGQNSQNKKIARSDSKTGVLGVQYHSNGYTATICKNHQDYYLGRYATVEAAHAAYVKAKQKLHEFGTLCLT